MNATTRSLRTCSEGHRYYKTSDCPTCPICEAKKKPKEGFLSTLSSPARQALEHAGITTLDALSTYSEREILALHGIGPSTIPKLRDALEAAGLSFCKPQ